MKKNKVFILFVCVICAIGLFFPKITVFAYDGDVNKHYVIYDEANNVLFEKSQVEIGDNYVNKDYKKYEVISLNKENLTGVAKFVMQLKKPKINISDTPSPIKTEGRHIGLYCTHNDESYLPSDGYYTIYGKGGIHDVAKKLKVTFENAGTNITFNETLHIPHDTSAYSRSQVTAKKLLNENDLNALFDIHRDGVSRSFYATVVDGQERSKVRIVVGKANPNKAVNEEFALYLSAVADELYPWLISDIYYATGHYNQNLFPKSLLFEMGTYLIEKDLVMSSIDPLVHVINTAMFNTTVNTKTGELNLGGTPSENNPLIDDALTGGFNNLLNSNSGKLLAVAFALLGVLFMLIITEVFIFIYEAVKIFKKRK